MVQNKIELKNTYYRIDYLYYDKNRHTYGSRRLSGRPREELEELFQEALANKNIEILSCTKEKIEDYWN